MEIIDGFFQRKEADTLRKADKSPIIKGKSAKEEKGRNNTMKLGIGVQTPDFISPYFSINAAKA